MFTAVYLYVLSSTSYIKSLPSTTKCVWYNLGWVCLLGRQIKSAVSKSLSSAKNLYYYQPNARKKVTMVTEQAEKSQSAL